MKKLILLTLLLVLPFNLVIGQEAEETNVIFGGARYDDGLLLTYGYGKKITGNLWSLNYLNWGNYGDLNTELAYFFSIEGIDKLHLGVLAGANTDWIDTYGDGNAPITYLVGATGGVCAYNFGELGLWGYAKYKYTLEPADNNYIDGYAFGGGLLYEF